MNFVLVVLFCSSLTVRAHNLNNGEQKTQWTLNENGITFPNEELFESIKRNDDKNPEAFFEACALGIRNGNYEPIKSFAKHSQTNANVLNENLPKIIQIAYANNLSNFEATLQFVNEFLRRTDLHRGYEALFNEMNKNNHLYNSEIIKLAYKVKQAIGETEDFQVNRTIQKRNANPLQHLMSRFPRSIEDLVSNKRCTIKNNDRNEYLYAANGLFNYDNDRGSVFTWRPGGEVGQGYWTMEPEDNGNYFLVKSDFWNQYMYAANDGFAFEVPVNFFFANKDRRRVFVWRPGDKVTQGRWVFEHLGDQNYAIRNKEWNEYLYSSSKTNDNDRRHVFTWIPGGRHRRSSWRVDCS